MKDEKSLKRLKWVGWLAPLLLLALLAPFCEQIDIGISSFFYDTETATFSRHGFYQWFYDYGQLPAWVAAGLALFWWCYSYYTEKSKELRPYLMLLILVFAIGPGLLVNGVMKPLWGRPRPRHITQLGGPVQFETFYSPKLNVFTRDLFKSMPSGHASMGFYFLSVAWVGLRLKRKELLFFGLSMTLFFGFFLGLTRIAQGGHFFTDVLIAALVCWWSVLFLDTVLIERRIRAVAHS